jgi:acyl-CoA synthetase (AMP-forming)/AMP-acid ligase II
VAVLDLAGLKVLIDAGVLAPTRPDRLLGMGLAVARWGISPATGYAAQAARRPHATALVDDEGSLTWRELDQRADRVAAELRRAGVAEGDPVGLLARNGRGFVQATVALARCGADVLYLNTGSSPEQMGQVLDRERALLVVHDEDLVPPPGARTVTTEELDRLSTQQGPTGPRRATRASRQVILTSGTTGAPRGAARSGAGAAELVSALSRIPLRAGETTVIAAPVFHAWGLGHLTLAMVLGSTAVLPRRFDPEQVLRLVEEHRATALVVVPVMLDRLLEADPSRFDLSSLRIIASSGSALPGDLATRVEAAFGPVLHSLYGSTEVAYAAVATPEDLRADPGTAGKAPYGVTLRVVDEAGRDCPPGVEGRIFVGSGLTFGGYTDGSDKDRLDGLVATGDLGTLDEEQRLTVLGRSDDMVVVGGENVHLNQVEEALRSHPSVADVSVVGAPDPSYGTRIVAHVVSRGSVSAEDLQAHVRERLARFAVPREVRFLESLPRNATGKVVKRELA